MKKNSFWMLAALLALGLVFTGCPTDTAGEPDTWSDVTSLDQLDGTWKVSYTYAQTIKEYMEAQGRTWTAEMESTFGDLKITANVTGTTTINANARTSAESSTIIMTYSGSNIDTLWPALKASAASLYATADSYSVDDRTHSITIRSDSPAQEMSSSTVTSFIEVFQINQSGTKLKMSANGSIPVDVIYYKQ